jgi:hypothetical protein
VTVLNFSESHCLKSNYHQVVREHLLKPAAKSNNWNTPQEEAGFHHDREIACVTEEVVKD